MSSPSAVLIGSVKPSLRAAPLGVRNPQADDALDVASVAGLDLYDWQAETLVDAMALSPTLSGRWAAREVGVVVGRQNGKGSILEVRQLAGLFVLGERLQVHSAHEFKTCYEHFRRVKGLVENCPLLAEQVQIIRTGAGDQAIELKNGNRIRFIARSGSSGRGFSADVVYLDEAFKLDDATIGALLPALSARPNSQIWYTSSAPHEDSTVLHRVRARAVEGNDPRLFFAEWGNDGGVDPLDREAWARANPSLGLRIDVEDIATEQRSLSPEEFARERLGVPEYPPSADESMSISPDVWAGCQRSASKIATNDCWALAVSPDRKWASIGIAGRTADGLEHIECLDRRPGTAWVVDRCVEVWGAKRLPVRIHKSAPEGAFIAELVERGVEVVEVSTADVSRSTGHLIDAANAFKLAHLGQGVLDRALVGAVLRAGADGASVWDARKSSVEITPLSAVTVALSGVAQEAPSWTFI